MSVVIRREMLMSNASTSNLHKIPIISLTKKIAVQVFKPLSQNVIRERAD